MVVDLTKMQAGESGIVVSLEGGSGFIQRLQNLGIRPGKKITKLNAHFWRGPVTVQEAFRLCPPVDLVERPDGLHRHHRRGSAEPNPGILKS